MKISMKYYAVVVLCAISCLPMQATQDNVQQIAPDATRVEHDKLLSMFELECLQEIVRLEKEQRVLIEQFNAKQKEMQQKRESARIMARRARIVVPIAVICAYALAYFISSAIKGDESDRAQERMYGGQVSHR